MTPRELARHGAALPAESPARAGTWSTRTRASPRRSRALDARRPRRASARCCTPRTRACATTTRSAVRSSTCWSTTAMAQPGVHRQPHDGRRLRWLDDHARASPTRSRISPARCGERYRAARTADVRRFASAEPPTARSASASDRRGNRRDPAVSVRISTPKACLSRAERRKDQQGRGDGAGPGLAAAAERRDRAEFARGGGRRMETKAHAQGIPDLVDLHASLDPRHRRPRGPRRSPGRRVPVRHVRRLSSRAPRGARRPAHRPPGAPVLPRGATLVSWKVQPTSDARAAPARASARRSDEQVQPTRAAVRLCGARAPLLGGAGQAPSRQAPRRLRHRREHHPREAGPGAREGGLRDHQPAPEEPRVPHLRTRAALPAVAQHEPEGRRRARRRAARRRSRKRSEASPA